jgi:hypothetical protein
MLNWQVGPGEILKEIHESRRDKYYQDTLCIRSAKAKRRGKVEYPMPYP